LRRLVSGDDKSLATIIGTLRGLFGIFKGKPNDNGTPAQSQTSFALDADNAPDTKPKVKRARKSKPQVDNGTLPNA
jgi:hypothetical protein